MSSLMPDEISMEDSLCNSSFGSMVTLDYVTPDTVPSRHVYREKLGEGVGTVSKAKCRWCVLGHRDPDIRQLERSSPTPQTSSIYTFLFVAAVLQREVTLGDLKSAFMQSDKDVSERSQGQLYASLLLEAFLLQMGHGLRKVP